MSVDTLLAIGLSGFAFGGADIPGFYGRPSNDLFIMFYQLGTFFPFMRAHCYLDSVSREPWS